MGTKKTQAKKCKAIQPIEEHLLGHSATGLDGKYSGQRNDRPVLLTKIRHPSCENIEQQMSREGHNTAQPRRGLCRLEFREQISLQDQKRTQRTREESKTDFRAILERREVHGH